MHISVVLSTFTLLCNHHHHSSPELFHLSQLNSLNTNSAFLPPTQALMITILLSVSMNDYSSHLL